MSRGGRPTVRTEFGERLHRARTQAKLSGPAAAKYLGIPQSTLAEAETKHNGSAITAQFARLYGVDAYWLATGEGEMLAIAAAAEPWPFRRIKPDAWMSADPYERAAAEEAALAKLREIRAERDQAAPQDESRKRDGTGG